MIRALIFDFDGLIVETEMPDYVAWHEIYQEHGAELPLLKWASIIGTRTSETDFDPVVYLESQVGRSLDADALLSRQAARSLEMSNRQPIMPGVEALIADAQSRGLKLAIASSSPLSWVVGQLDRVGLRHQFEVIKTVEDVERAKPDPALYLEALNALDVAPSDAVVLEDSLNGVIAARRAGIFTVAVPNDLTRHLDLSPANLIVASLSDVNLDDLAARLNGHRA